MSSQQLPTRLIRLNEDLTSGKKRLDHVYATRREHRIRVLVERVEREPRHWVSDKDYRASATFNGRRLASYGILPSHAFIRLIDHLCWAVAKFEFDRNMADDLAASTKRQVDTKTAS